MRASFLLPALTLIGLAAAQTYETTTVTVYATATETATETATAVPTTATSYVTTVTETTTSSPTTAATESMFSFQKSLCIASPIVLSLPFFRT
jgi:hypothetical protein